MLWLLNGRNGARVDKASLFFLLFFAAARALSPASQKLRRGLSIVKKRPSRALNPVVATVLSQRVVERNAHRLIPSVG